MIVSILGIALLPEMHALETWNAKQTVFALNILTNKNSQKFDISFGASEVLDWPEFVKDRKSCLAKIFLLKGPVSMR